MINHKIKIAVQISSRKGRIIISMTNSYVRMINVWLKYD